MFLGSKNRDGRDRIEFIFFFIIRFLGMFCLFLNHVSILSDYRKYWIHELMR